MVVLNIIHGSVIRSLNCQTGKQVKIILKSLNSSLIVCYQFCSLILLSQPFNLSFFDFSCFLLLSLFHLSRLLLLSYLAFSLLLLFLPLLSLFLLSCKLLVNFLFKPDQHGGQHAYFSTLSCHLQKCQNNVLFILLEHQIIRLEHDDLHHLEKTTKLDELEHVVTCEPRARGHVLSDRKISFRNRETRRLPLVLPSADQLHNLGVSSPNCVCMPQKVFTSLKT